MENSTAGIYIRRPIKRGRFYIDNEVVDRGYLKVLKRGWLVYTVLARHANAKAQVCFLSYETIMRESGIKNPTKINQALDQLVKLNMIAIRRESRRRSNVYYLVDSATWRQPDIITGDNTRVLSKDRPKYYQNGDPSNIAGDKLNQLEKSTREIKDINILNAKKLRGDLADKMRWPG